MVGIIGTSNIALIQQVGMSQRLALIFSLQTEQIVYSYPYQNTSGQADVIKLTKSKYVNFRSDAQIITWPFPLSPIISGSILYPNSKLQINVNSVDFLVADVYSNQNQLHGPFTKPGITYNDPASWYLDFITVGGCSNQSGSALV